MKDSINKISADIVLKESEARIKSLISIVEQSTDGIAQADLEGNLIFVNNAWCKMHGYKYSKDCLGKNLKIFHSKEQFKNDVIPFNKEVKKYGTYSGEVGHITKEGKSFPTLMTSTLLKDINGNPYAMAGIAKDITERKKASTQLRKSEQKYRLLAENTSDVISLQSFDLNVTLDYISPSVKEMTGYKPEELIGKSLFGFVHPEDKRELLPVLKEYINYKIKKLLTGKEIPLTKTFDLRLKHKLGHWIYVQSTGNILGNQLLFITRDITERKNVENAQLESVQNFKDLVENLKGGVAIVNENGNHIFVNSQFCKLTGYSKDELKNITGWDLTRPEDIPVFKQRMEDRLAGKPHQKEYERIILRKDGTELPVEFSTTKTPWKGKILPMAIIHDITERKKAENTLRESEEFNKRIIASSNDCIKVLDLEGNLLSMNSGGQILLEIDDITIYLNKSWTDFWKGEDNKAALKAISVAKKGGIGKFTGFCETEKGTQKWWEIVVTPINDTDGKIENLLAISRDITERKQIEEALREKTETINAIVNTSMEWIWTIDLQGIHTYSNPAIEQILGYPPNKLVGSPSFDLMHEDDRKMITTKFPDWISEKKGWKNLEIRWRHKDGSWRYLESSAVPIINVDSEIIGFHGVDRDITERKLAEAELKKHRDHLEELVKERTAEIEEKNINLQRFHDATINRELRMKELKDENDSLKSQLKRSQ